MNRFESFLRTVGAQMSVCISFVCLLCILVTPAQSWGAYTYETFDFDSSSGWSYPYVYGINNNGTIVGSGVNVQIQGFIRTAGGMVTPIWSDGWLNASAQGINGSGGVVGYYNSSDSVLPFYYTSGSLGTLPLPSGWDWAMAQGVNSNTVVGYGYEVGGSDFKSFIHTLNTTSASELEIDGWTQLRAMAINGSGMVAGIGDDGSGPKGFLYLFDSTIGSGSFVKSFILPSELTGVEAMGINKAGTIVLGGQDDSGYYRGFVSNGAGHEEILPKGEGWSLLQAQATGINDDGTIVGWGYDDAGQRGFIARVSSVPEPASLLLLLTGLGCIPLLRRVHKAS